MADKKPHELIETSPAYRQGDDLNVATTILLSAPGREEEKTGRPAAGETGKTLRIALEKLHGLDVCSFPSLRLDDYSIANAIETIHYKNKTGRTEATDCEIRSSTNIGRIKSILSNCKTVIALGDKAFLAIQDANYEGVVFAGKHPSLQSLNSNYKSTCGAPNERRRDRIDQWVNDLFKSRCRLKV